jgi:hypothetical protein
MKTVPRNAEFGLALTGKKNGVRVDLILPEQIEWIDLKSMKHQPSIISCLPYDTRGAGEHGEGSKENR